jgi:hypothetical protein
MTATAVTNRVQQGGKLGRQHGAPRGGDDAVSGRQGRFDDRATDTGGGARDEPDPLHRVQTGVGGDRTDGTNQQNQLGHVRSRHARRLVSSVRLPVDRSEWGRGGMSLGKGDGIRAEHAAPSVEGRVHGRVASDGRAFRRDGTRPGRVVVGRGVQHRPEHSCRRGRPGAHRATAVVVDAAGSSGPVTPPPKLEAFPFRHDVLVPTVHDGRMHGWAGKRAWLAAWPTPVTSHHRHHHRHHREHREHEHGRVVDAWLLASWRVWLAGRRGRDGFAQHGAGRPTASAEFGAIRGGGGCGG